jgi:hypothetical protein
LKFTYDEIPQSSGIAFPMLGKFDDALGDHRNDRISAIQQAQGAQGILERGCERSYVFRRE